MKVLSAKLWSRAGAAAGVMAAVLVLAACGGGESSSSTSGGGASGGGEEIGVTLITKDPSNHFWTAMVDGAQAGAKGANVNLTVAAGRDQTDADSQIRAIEDAVSRGDKAILIAHNGPAVFDAIRQARDAGLLVIALDTPTDPISLTDATFASDNMEAGKLIGQWTAAQLGDKPAKIAMLDLFGDKVVGIDLERDHGFLEGMGIRFDPKKNGGEPRTGTHAGGGSYEIVCHGTTDGAEDGGRSAMENCLSIDPDINVVFTANETSGVGAVQALKAAGVKDALVSSIDGSCRGVQTVKSGDFGAVAQQYPFKMGELGVKAAVDFAENGTKPQPPAGSDFVNTGIKLIADAPADGVDSITSEEGLKVCW